MQFSKLRLLGFKSFVEPTEFDILPGLTGVIGPNGCGKSNLVEALRWVMGESSYKSMRASGLEDVIFAGGGDRPARNVAEVRLTLDNSARTAPASFNDADVLEITRRIERDQGSTYRINGREVRARDVQILFADASTGSRSPALVRQGQISEIIAAKPQARRRVLEDAAGIAGLHTRRHEAELRLKGAEDNLARIDDVLTQIAGQSDGLRRQARQAQRFREVQAELRRMQALAVLIAWEEAKCDSAAAETALAAAETAVVDCTRAQGEAARHQAVAAHALPELRSRESEASSALQNVLVARQMLDGEERRAKGRRAETERRIKEMTADLGRERAAVDDATAALARLEAEGVELAAFADPATVENNLRARAGGAEETRRAAEATLADVQTAHANAEARRRALSERVRDDAAQVVRVERELAQAAAALAASLASAPPEGAFDAANQQLRAATDALARAESMARTTEADLDTARASEAASRAPFADADRVAQRLETEVKTMTKMLEADTGGRWPPVTDAIVVTKGYEKALGSALGDDLDASSDTDAPAHWADVAGDGDPALPEGSTALSHFVEAPPALRRRLHQIGLVERAAGALLRSRLATGQRLVSVEGDLWRWDGLTQAAEAPTPAARRLTERNRLADLRDALAAARAQRDQFNAVVEIAQTTLRTATASDAAARAELQTARRACDAARAAHADLERQHRETATKLAVLAATERAARSAREAAVTRRAESEAALATCPETNDLLAQIETVRADVERLRAEEADARATLQLLSRERDARARRIGAIEQECGSWQTRAGQAESRQIELTQRLESSRREMTQFEDEPDRFILARRRLLADIEAAEKKLRASNDARATGETTLADADRRARAALDAMAGAREIKARSESRVEAAMQKLDDIVRTAARDLDCEAAAALPLLAGVRHGEPRPSAAEVATKLDALKADRERLGAVNLRAEEELAAMEAQRTGLDQEKTDLTEAIRRLRQAIGNLNKEGRERLLGAFDRVNGFFKELFTTLFGGGMAELQLVESDDPLEAGLEIVARPPGKKPQVMTLLSGGEQALTAISLIFAVFLTNPSPICVLDEVDAPLDDANVERFCDLVDAMRSKTETRFIAITHNPITMARMDRLCGVTQAERGVSQLVSVDLTEATELLEAS